MLFFFMFKIKLKSNSPNGDCGDTVRHRTCWNLICCFLLEQNIWFTFSFGLILWHLGTGSIRCIMPRCQLSKNHKSVIMYSHLVLIKGIRLLKQFWTKKKVVHSGFFRKEDQKILNHPTALKWCFITVNETPQMRDRCWNWNTQMWITNTGLLWDD